MTTQLDSSIGIKKETVYGTGVTVDHFPEFLSESLTYKPNYILSKGLRVASRVSRAERRTLGKNWVEGDIELEACARGIGIFLEALLGQGTPTIIGAGPGYQHVYSLATTDPINSYTIQKGIPLLGGGAAQAHTFTGMVCTKGSISSETGDVVKLKTSWVGKAMSTAVAYAAPSYVATNELFNFWQGAITMGGSVTNPSSTSLATGGTAATNVKNFSLEIDQKMDVDGFLYGTGGQQGRKPVLGYAEIKGKVTVEFDSVAQRDIYLANTSQSLTLTFTTNTALGGGVFNTLQIVLPTIRLDGDIPKAVSDGVVTLDLDFTVLDGGSAGVSPVYVVLRTLDTVA
jgi:hypothetical protein